MPKLSDHGLGGGGKGVGVPIYPFDTQKILIKDDVNGYPFVNYVDNMTAAPVDLRRSGMCVYGGKLKFIGCYTNNEACYDYNISSKTWTKTTDKADGITRWAILVKSVIYYAYGAGYMRWRQASTDYEPSSQTTVTIRNCSDSDADTDGTNIYQFSSSHSNYSQNATRINIADKTYTDLSKIPLALGGHNGVVYGGDGYMYLFGGASYPNKAYKYNIENNTYVALADIPREFYDGIVVRHDGYIYLICDGCFMVYDIGKNEYVDGGNIKYNRDGGYGKIYNNLLYVVSGEVERSTGESYETVKVIKNNGKVDFYANKCKIYTDGKVLKSDDYSQTIQDLMFIEATEIEKSNGVVNIPSDGKYVIVDANYATIGG